MKNEILIKGILLTSVIACVAGVVELATAHVHQYEAPMIDAHRRGTWLLIGGIVGSVISFDYLRN